MKELKAPDKITQQMTRDGAVEVNKATGGAERIGARDAADASPDDDAPGGVIGRIQTERGAAKKKAQRKANAKIFKRTQRKPETPRLKFTDAERADPALAKSVKKSDKAAERFEAARARIPKEKVLTVERVSDRPGGKAETRLVFRERDKPPNGKLTHALDRPGREAALAAHGEIDRSNADGNTGVSAAHFSEKTAEGAVRKAREGYRSLKMRPYRAAAKAGEKTFRANVNALYERSIRLNPELAGAGPLSKALHKRKIKRGYAKAFRRENIGGAKKTAEAVRKGAGKAREAAQNAVKFAAGHLKGLALFGGGLLSLTLLVAGIGSCASMFGGGFNAIIGTSYTAEDGDINGADTDYTALETQLAARIANIQSEYPGYDEYRLSLDEIGHDPFELASYLTAKFNMYTRAEAQAELAALFARQYTLTVSPVTETRYRTEWRSGSYTDSEGNSHSYSYTVEVPYSYHILNVSLTNRSLGSVAAAGLTPEQTEMYAVYMETKGNKPELFADNVYVNRGEYTDYDIPPEALADSTFAVMIGEAEKYLGMAYVWGGSSPATGFDCSGFVSWVVNHSGWSMGRLTANGLMTGCAIIPPGEAKPGDLIFFRGTYDVSGASHVGIYVGNGMMIHCGNPISYASVTTTYWTNHFYCYGRLP
jgi:cell wall-associated NlpC family hydrolase